jgi:hypothetical protein
MDNLFRAIRTSFQRRHLGPFCQSYPAPLQIPDPLKKWPKSTGIGGRFQPEYTGGKLDKSNRWLRIGKLIPWEDMEIEYGKAFSDIGRPAKDAQLVIGLLLLKHMTGLLDRDVVAEVLENPYMQAFCGFRSMATEETLDPSTLSKIRQKLGLSFFRSRRKWLFQQTLFKEAPKSGRINPRLLHGHSSFLSYREAGPPIHGQGEDLRTGSSSRRTNDQDANSYAYSGCFQ